MSSRLAYPDVRAALAAARRDGRLEPELRRAQASWAEFWAATRAVELTDAVAMHAGDLAERHSLRGADAVHPACLLAIGADDILFAVWEARLRAGDAAAGLPLVP